MALPAETISLADKARTVSLLAAAGAPIAGIKRREGNPFAYQGGPLAAAARAIADVVTLVLSDLGDDGWHLVASAPTLGAPPSRRDAAGDPRELSAPVRSFRPPFASTSSPRTARTARGRAASGGAFLLGDVRTALEGARREAQRLGADVRVLPELLAGEARSASRRLAVAGACAGNLVRRAGIPSSGVS